MQLGMIGLGRMGANMARRLLNRGHSLVVHDVHAEAVDALVAAGASPAYDLASLAGQLAAPRTLWIMLPAALVDQVIDSLGGLLEAGDVVIDGGNSYYKDDIQRAKRLKAQGLHYVDVGTSGGIWGRERGYCLMIGGEPEITHALDPIFRDLAPGLGHAARTPGREGAPAPEEQGYLHCGPVGAGHFVKMVHNGIEYALMAAYAEGFNLLGHANVGLNGEGASNAETTPLRDPEGLSYELPLPEIAELWRRGSVVSSWLLDLTAGALYGNPGLDGLSARVADSGEGRWTSLAAIEAGVPAPVLSAALFDRFASRGQAEFANRMLSAMRLGFGGHLANS